jgi:hypothetical protein
MTNFATLIEYIDRGSELFKANIAAETSNACILIVITIQ